MDGGLMEYNGWIIVVITIFVQLWRDKNTIGSFSRGVESIKTDYKKQYLIGRNKH